MTAPSLTERSPRQVTTDLVVSVVNHENRDRVLALLASLEGEARGDLFRIAVLDNASTDGSVEAIRRQHPEVQVIAQRYRAGFGSNHNRVLAASDEPYVLLINDDARIAPDHVAGLLEYMRAHPSVGAVAPEIIGADGQRQQTAWALPTPASALLFALSLGQIGWVQSTGEHPRRVGRLSGCVLLLRRDAVERVGGFDEAFFMYAEDADLAHRLQEAGFESHFVPTFSATHESQQSSAAHPRRRQNEQWRSMGLYLRKHLSRPKELAVRALLAMGFAAKTLAATAGLGGRGRGKALASEFATSCFYALGLRGGPGLRELADAFNGDAGVRSVPDGG